MERKRGGPSWSLLSILALLALADVSARADDEGCWLPWWKRIWVKKDPGRAFQGRGGPPHTFEQAGHPDEISRFARPSETPNYIGYYVGGGCTFRGGPPGPADGTYGWDYAGLCCHAKKIVLNWCHRYQGGSGPYKIDGPKTPDIGPYIEKLREGPGHKEKHEEHESHEGHEGHAEHAHSERLGNGHGGSDEKPH
jgi:hypothetical protein